MVEIKFRAWDKIKKHMAYLGDLGVDISYGNSVETGDICYKYGCEDDFHDDYYARSIDDHAIMQYTGLKDKNGKEIYDGDIVRVNSIICLMEEDMPTSIYTVSFQPPCSLFIRKGHAWIMYDLSSDYEVIGNKYENPELLESKNETN